MRAAGAGGLEPVVRIGAAVAALGSLLSLVLGVSRTTLAMARDRHLPAGLAAVHPRFGVPHRAEVAVGVVVAALAAVADVRGAIGFSSFAVLLYYAVANASAWTLGQAADPGGRVGRLRACWPSPCRRPRCSRVWRCWRWAQRSTRCAGCGRPSTAVGSVG